EDYAPRRRRRRYDDYDSPRRNTAPHRGGTILTLGILSLVLAFCAPAGLILGILAAALGGSDLGQIRRGEMDRDGQGTTQAAQICGILGIVLSILCFCFSIVDLANRPRMFR